MIGNPRKTHRRRQRTYQQSIGIAESRRRKERMRQLIAKYKGVCAICGLLVSFREGSQHEATCDHIVPLSRGGLDVPKNWQLACRECNHKKGNSMPEEIEDGQA